MDVETIPSSAADTKNQPAESGDVFAKMAESLTAKRQEQKAAETVKEVKVEEIKAFEIKAEEPVSPQSNGKSEKPKQDIEIPVTTEPVIEEDWRKNLGFEDSTITTTEVVEKVQDFKKEYEAATKELDSLTSDPFITAYKEAKKTGKDVFSFINEVKGVDVERLTPEQIWDANLKNEGLSPEDITLEMEKFETLSPFEKKQKTKAFKQELITNQHENLKKYASESGKSAIEQEKLAKLAEEQGKQFFNKIKDKEWQGMKMTAPEVQKLQDYLANDFQMYNADGSINFDLFAKVGNYALNERTILQNVFKKGETKGYEKALLEISRPSANDKKFNSPPVIQNNNKLEAAKAAVQTAFGQS